MPPQEVEQALVSDRLQRIEEHTSETRDQLKLLVALEQKRDKREETSIKLAAETKANWWGRVVGPVVAAVVSAVGTLAATWAAASGSSGSGTP